MMSKARDSYHHGNLRAAVLEAAVDVIRERGVTGLSLRGIARALGVSHGAPGRHFANKGELLSAVIEDGWMKLAMTTRGAAERAPGDPVGQLRAMMRAYVGWAASNPAHHGVMRNPEVIRHATPELKAKLQLFAHGQLRAVEQAQRTGWRAGEDPRTIVFRIASAVAGASLVLADPLYRDVMGEIDADALVGPLIDALIAPAAGWPRSRR